MSRTLQVLVVEDNPADDELIREMLRDPGPVLLVLTFVHRLADALAALRRTTPDLVLLDLGLPDSQGLDALDKLRVEASDLPIVVLTGSSDQELGAAAVKAGAQDHFVKGHATGTVLGRALLYAVERKQAQEALHISEARYRRLFETSMDGILIVEAATGTVLDANPALVTLLGHSRDTLLQKSIWEIGWLADVMANPEHLAELWRVERVHRDDVSLETIDGRVIHVELVSAIYSVNRGKVIQCNLRDISVRVRAAEALRQSEEWHRLLFAGSRDALMTLATPAWQFTSGNSAAVTMLGAADETDLLTRSPIQCSPERQPDGRDSAEEFGRRMEAAMHEGVQLFEWTHRRISGEEFPATVLLTRLEVGGRAFLQATVRDETEKKRLQASVAQADRLSSMGMLAAGIAHEINNPLSYLLYNVESLAKNLPKLALATTLYLAALRDRLGDAPLAEFVDNSPDLLPVAAFEDAVERAQEALAGAQRIKEVSRGLGTFARVEGSQRAMVHLNYPIECAISLSFNEIKYRARLVKDYGRVPAVLASEGKLSQVFLNLLLNAAHAIDEGHVESNRIGVRTWCEGEDVFGEVTDTGSGIPPENLERIFEPFFTTKAAGAGSGLGLAICRNIIGEFGGDIRVESELGKGTRFVIRLPAPSGAPGSPSDAVSEHAPPHAAVRGRILVADEEEEALCRMTCHLLGADHEVDTAAQPKLVASRVLACREGPPPARPVEERR